MAAAAPLLLVHSASETAGHPAEAEEEVVVEVDHTAMAAARTDGTR